MARQIGGSGCASKLPSQSLNVRLCLLVSSRAESVLAVWRRLAAVAACLQPGWAIWRWLQKSRAQTSTAAAGPGPLACLVRLQAPTGVRRGQSMPQWSQA